MELIYIIFLSYRICLNSYSRIDFIFFQIYLNFLRILDGLDLFEQFKLNQLEIVKNYYAFEPSLPGLLACLG
jgi:hypothetical protein